MSARITISVDMPKHQKNCLNFIQFIHLIYGISFIYPEQAEHIYVPFSALAPCSPVSLINRIRGSNRGVLYGKH